MKLRKFVACENLREAQEKLLKGAGDRLSLFRGDASASYELIPSALRKMNIKNVHGVDAKEPLYEFQQVAEEQRALAHVRAVREARQAGRPPKRSELRDALYYSRLIHKDMSREEKIAIIERDFPEWIPDDLVETASLAQHIGIPTRAYDWTTNLDMAVSFAAHGAIQEGLWAKETGNEVEWIRNARMAIHKFDVEAFNKLKGDNPNRLRIFQPDYSMNANARAQSGYLLHRRIKPPYDGLVDRRPFDVALAGDAMEFGVGKEYDGEPVFTTCSVPAAYCNKIMRELLDEGISMSTMFPTEVGTQLLEKASRNYVNYERVFER